MLSRRTIRRHKRTKRINQIANSLKLGSPSLSSPNEANILQFQTYEELPSDILPSTSSVANSSTIEPSIVIEDEEAASNAYQEPQEDKICASLLTLFYSGNLTQSAFKLVLEHTQLLTQVTLPKSFDQLLIKMKVFESDEYNKTWFCQKCKKKTNLICSKQRACLICKEKLHVYYYSSIKKQLELIFNRLLPIGAYNCNNTLISDVKDGSIYTSFKVSKPSDNIYSFTLNSDGISLCEKSNLSIWPVYLALNELDISHRYHFDNLIIAGLCVGNSKPNMDEFLNPIYNELADLELGIQIAQNWYSFYLLFAVFDKPARAALLNMTLSNGKYGCLKCQQRGETLPFGNGHHHVFPFDELNIDKPLRNANNYDIDLHYKQNGIKGNCIFNKLSYFNPVVNCNIDIMHSLFLGVVKTLFVYWFDHPSSHNYSLKSKISDLNQRLLDCQPPDYISQAPRRLEDFHKWRAHEFMNFILYFSIPVFFRKIDSTLFHHLLKLIIPLEYLLSPKINKDKLNLIHNSLVEFVKEAGNIYDVHIHSSGMHELLHFVQCTSQFGPMNDLNCFPFEELNRVVTRKIKGQDLVGDEFLKVSGVSRKLSYFISSLAEDKSDKFNNFMMKFQTKSSNLKRLRPKSNTLKLGNKIHVTFDSLTHRVKFFLKDYVNELNFSLCSFRERFYFNKILFRTDSNRTNKFSNYVIMLGQSIGIIKFIIQTDDKQIILLVQKLEFLNTIYSNNINVNHLMPHYNLYSLNQSYFVINSTEFVNLKKLFLFYEDTNICLITTFTSNHVFT